MFCYALVFALALAAACAHAGTGVTQIGATTVFYPTAAADQAVQRGPFTLKLAPNAPPQRGNNRLVVLSHGSGGAAWTYTGLATQLVQAGFIVASPEHDGDNWHDMSKVGPPSWKLRPGEVIAAIDLLAADARFGPLFDPAKVGMYGMSAGGHTALALAGGRWSPARLKAHCAEKIDEDFATCAGTATQLTGGALDGLKKGIVLMVHRLKFDDTQAYGQADPRIVAIVAEVPFAVDFDMQTLQAPKVKLGLVEARKDIWLVPRFHIDSVREACKACDVIADLPTAGHGSLMSPQPRLTGVVATLIADPPGFDRAEVPVAHARIVAWLRKNLE